MRSGDWVDCIPTSLAARIVHRDKWQIRKKRLGVFFFRELLCPSIKNKLFFRIVTSIYTSRLIIDMTRFLKCRVNVWHLINYVFLAAFKKMRRIGEKVWIFSSRNKGKFGKDSLKQLIFHFNKKIREKRKVVEKSSLWSEGIIPFDFQDPLPDVSKVFEGIEHWETYTCLRFTRVNTSNSKSAHIIFKKLKGCRSSVGRKEEPGQVVSIGETCNKVGIVVHEIGHALGFYHEIRRSDRDDFVVINYENILEEERFNFDKMDSVSESVPYDLSSIMHYSPLEWSENGKTTVATRDPMLQGIVGGWKVNQSLGLSHRDKLIANIAYGCIDKWLAECKLESDHCKGEGYLGASCKCICPPGRTGDFCETEIGFYYDELKSGCSETIRYESEITSPGYPFHYPNESWCTYEIASGEKCLLPSVTILDFELGPRDVFDHCSFDYLEIRHENPYYVNFNIFERLQIVTINNVFITENVEKN
ncbi:Protein SpAN [Armadillidium nasatum]|uniref:Metalloendopeptidase n=1 Tax=Armadillidium nasatum TaxID=96803 RepID=A0A5N5TLN5_9CRUS|nr:Protein SpAN [Armadillidium nasatum]